MILPVISMLSKVVGTLAFAKGPNAKSNAGGLVGALMLGASPMIEQFQLGVTKGVGTSLEELGYAVGMLVAGGVIGKLTVWLSPKND